jgi:hypothetical protein
MVVALSTKSASFFIPIHSAQSVKLPRDILALIFSYLDLHTLHHVTLCNKQLKGIVYAIYESRRKGECYPPRIHSDLCKRIHHFSICHKSGIGKLLKIPGLSNRDIFSCKRLLRNLDPNVKDSDLPYRFSRLTIHERIEKVLVASRSAKKTLNSQKKKRIIHLLYTPVQLICSDFFNLVFCLYVMAFCIFCSLKRSSFSSSSMFCQYGNLSYNPPRFLH